MTARNRLLLRKRCRKTVPKFKYNNAPDIRKGPGHFLYSPSSLSMVAIASASMARTSASDLSLIPFTNFVTAACAAGSRTRRIWNNFRIASAFKSHFPSAP